ncbi:hypothetical protein GCM10009122_26650 [Fulvivirga kasyanovii]|uniref:LamG domain-containing protein n=1 Tax=Fulvivirga kasyanovii TaxID=396812 RepID=A0ABW9RQ25_9BACT|nr:LamG domain-containing protein [Fulvivirga kasyanovii]MTI26116.1 LamG domain-containing protein [Fulvivirga kasyanovii]
MKLYKLYIMGAIFAFGCDDGYIDDISAVDPGPDESAPVVTISNPVGDVFIPFTENSTDVTFKFQATDDIEVKSVTIALDGAELASFSGFVDYRNANNSFTYEDLPIGEHTVAVTAIDPSGKETTESVTFIVTNEYFPEDGEIFYMPFEGDVFLDIISEKSATTSGAPGFADGIKGNALSLDAANESYILFPGDTLAGVENFTLSFWAKVDYVGDESGIDGSFGLVSLSNVSSFWGNIEVLVDGGNLTNGANMKAHVTNGASETWVTGITNLTNIFGQWSNHTLTYDATSSEIKYYINGELKSTTPAAWTGPLAFENVGPMVFGTYQFQTTPSLTSATGSQPWASFLTGEIDEVRIFNRALSADEIQALVDDVD